jgi:hypothetical protein
MIRLWKFTYLFSLLALAGNLAFGSLGDWLFGGVVKTVATTAQNITYAVVLKQIVDTLSPYLPILVIGGFAFTGVLCLIQASRTMEGFQAAWRSANADSKITVTEWIWLVLQYIPNIIIAGVLLWFGGVLVYMSSGALLQIANTIPKGH